MKLTVLVDNNTLLDVYYWGEPGLSYYIEDGSDTILFDTGYSNVFMINAENMGVDLDRVNKVVLSHGHDDHTGGLKYFFDKNREVELITHPYSLVYKDKEENGNVLPIGSPILKDELSKLCRLNLSEKPVKVSEHITFLGEIPNAFAFEPRYVIGRTVVDGQMVDDTMIEDSALVYECEKGLFIITGCSHSGICNIIEYAKKVCGDDRICGVIGGFHLLHNDERLQNTIRYFAENHIELLYPCHCVSLEAKIEMAKQMKIHEVGVGLKLEL